MFVTITSLRLRRLRDFFRLSYFGWRIAKQARAQKGFRRMKNTGFGYLHFTITAWESEPDLKSFAASGAHREALGASRELATEIRIHTFEGEDFPGWKEAKRMLFEKGRVYQFD